MESTFDKLPYASGGDRRDLVYITRTRRKFCRIIRDEERQRHLVSLYELINVISSLKLAAQDLFLASKPLVDALSTTTLHSSTLQAGDTSTSALFSKNLCHHILPMYSAQTRGLESYFQRWMWLYPFDRSPIDEFTLDASCLWWSGYSALLNCHPGYIIPLFLLSPLSEYTSVTR